MARGGRVGRETVTEGAYTLVPGVMTTDDLVSDGGGAVATGTNRIRAARVRRGAMAKLALAKLFR